jgi:antitoxin VapB
LIPQDDPWEALVQSLDAFSDDFLTERRQPELEEREPLA